MHNSTKNICQFLLTACIWAVKSVLLIILFLSAGISTASAQQSGILRVVALSESDGNPLAGANVLIYEPGAREQNEEPNLYCVTDRNGFCEIRNVQAEATFELVITFIGHRPYMVSLHSEGPLERDRQSFLIKGRTSTIEQFGPALTGQDIPIQFSDLVTRYTVMDDDITCNLTGIYTHDRGEIVPGRNVDHTWSNMVIGGRCLDSGAYFQLFTGS